MSHTQCTRSTLQRTHNAASLQDGGGYVRDAQQSCTIVHHKRIHVMDDGRALALHVVRGWRMVHLPTRRKTRRNTMASPQQETGATAPTPSCYAPARGSRLTT
jgi:hypothetical protein